MNHDPAVLRILDASLNRACEGLRVVEDYTRMVLDDAHLARQFKEMRHNLSGSAMELFNLHEWLYSRDTPGDVGRFLSTSSETERECAWQVAAASCKRAEQALRTLEEYGKLLDSGFAAQCESERYRLYTLEKMAFITTDSRSRLKDILLMFLIDGGDSPKDFDETLALLTITGASAIQLRDKRLNDSELLQCARHLRRETRIEETLLIVNDRPDIAVAADADGVHLGQDDMPVADARKIVGPNRLIGVSTHNIEQARQAVVDGANYLGAGPVFPSNTKQFDEYAGLDFLRQVAAEISLPTFAIGGINSGNLAQVLETGMSRVAVAGAIQNAENPKDEAALIWEKLLHNVRFAENSPAPEG